MALVLAGVYLITNNINAIEEINVVFSLSSAT
jgi:hypothetical protein